jgi:hypothetical protein
VPGALISLLKNFSIVTRRRENGISQVPTVSNTFRQLSGRLPLPTIEQKKWG